MAKPLKDAGVRELDSLMRRVKRQLAMERISREDHDYMIEHLEAVQERINSMREKGEESLW